MQWNSNAKKQRRKEKNCLTNEERSYRRKIRQYLQQVDRENERVFRRFAKFAETKKKNGRLEYGSANNEKICGIRGRCDAC